MFFFIRVWINGWVNNREAGDLRRYRAHYNVIVMELPPKDIPSGRQTFIAEWLNSSEYSSLFIYYCNDPAIDNGLYKNSKMARTILPRSNWNGKIDTISDSVM